MHGPMNTKFTIINVHRSYVKYPSFLSDFSETWILSTYFRKILKYQVSWKSVYREPRSSTRMNGQTHMTRLIAAFRNAHNINLAARMAGIKPNLHSLGHSGLWRSVDWYVRPFGHAASSTCVAVKMDAVGFFKTYVTIYQSTLRHIQQISTVACCWFILLIEPRMKSNRVAGSGIGKDTRTLRTRRKQTATTKVTTSKVLFRKVGVAKHKYVSCLVHCGLSVHDTDGVLTDWYGERTTDKTTGPSHQHCAL